MESIKTPGKTKLANNFSDQEIQMRIDLDPLGNSKRQINKNFIKKIHKILMKQSVLYLFNQLIYCHISRVTWPHMEDKEHQTWFFLKTLKMIGSLCVAAQSLRSNGVRGLKDIYRLFKYLSGINYSHSSFGAVLLHEAKPCLLAQPWTLQDPKQVSQRQK